MQFFIPTSQIHKPLPNKVTLLPKMKVEMGKGLASRFSFKHFNPHTILEVRGVHAMFFDLLSSS